MPQSPQASKIRHARSWALKYRGKKIFVWGKESFSSSSGPVAGAAVFKLNTENAGSHLCGACGLAGNNLFVFYSRPSSLTPKEPFPREASSVIYQATLLSIWITPDAFISISHVLGRIIWGSLPEPSSALSSSVPLWCAPKHPFHPTTNPVALVPLRKFNLNPSAFNFSPHFTSPDFQGYMLWKHWEASLSCHQNHNNYVSKIITAWCGGRLIPSDRESSLPADKSNCRLAEIWDKINHRAQALCPPEFHQIHANSASPHPSCRCFTNGESVCCWEISKRYVYLYMHEHNNTLWQRWNAVFQTPVPPWERRREWEACECISWGCSRKTREIKQRGFRGHTGISNQNTIWEADTWEERVS